METAAERICRARGAPREPANKALRPREESHAVQDAVHPTVGHAVAAQVVAVMNAVGLGGEDQAMALQPANARGDLLRVRRFMKQVGSKGTEGEAKQRGVRRDGEPAIGVGAAPGPRQP